MRVAASHRTGGQRLIAVFAAISMVLSLMVIYAQPVFADGEDSSAECESMSGNTDMQSDVTVATASSGHVITAICIKSGGDAFGDSKHSGVITSDGNYSGFVVSGMGTEQVTVTATDAAAHEVSHIDYQQVQVETEPETGNLQIKKEATDDTELEFTFTGPDGTFTLKHGESFFFEAELGVEFTFTEILPDGWRLEDIDCDTEGGSAVIDLENNSVTMVVTDPGSPFKCHFDNEEGVFEEPTVGTLQIKKEATDDTELEFTFTGPDGTFTLKHGESFFFEAELGVEFTFTEIVPEGWFLEDIDCDDDDGTAVIDLENNSVTMVVTDPGSPFKCNFDNEEEAAPEVSPEVLPEIAVTKTADTAEAVVGDTVTFTVVISNPSATEPVRISSIVDSVFGVLAGDADCMVDITLAAGASCEFTFTWMVTGDDGGTHENVVEVIGVDVERPEVTVKAEAKAVVLVSEVGGIVITPPEQPAGPVTPVDVPDVVAGVTVEAEELPFTGIESDGLIVLAITLLGGGVLLLRWAPRREEG